MIILDEHLLGRDVVEPIARWSRSHVGHILDLRPGTLSKMTRFHPCSAEHVNRRLSRLILRTFGDVLPPTTGIAFSVFHYRTVVSTKFLDDFVMCSVSRSFGQKQLGWAKLPWSVISRFSTTGWEIASGIRCYYLDEG